MILGSQFAINALPAVELQAKLRVVVLSKITCFKVVVARGCTKAAENQAHLTLIAVSRWAVHDPAGRGAAGLYGIKYWPYFSSAI